MRWGNRWKDFVTLLGQFHNRKVDASQSQYLISTIEAFTSAFAELTRLLMLHQKDLRPLDGTIAFRLIDNSEGTWPFSVIQKLSTLHDEAKELKHDPAWIEIFVNEREQLNRMLTAPQESYLADLLMMCVLASRPSAEKTVRYFVSGEWPTRKDDDGGYIGHHLPRHHAYAAAVAIEQRALQHVREHPGMPEGRFTVSADKNTNVYALTDLQSFDAGGGRLVFFCEMHKPIIHLYFCFFVTEKTHYASVNTMRCINSYSRMHRKSCDRYLVSNNFSGWRELSTLDVLKTLKG